MNERVVMIDVDDLGIDQANMRGGRWNMDEGLIEDIKTKGMLTPLIVRRAKPTTGVKYAIVCGSRRYNAAIEVGLTEVPCIIKELSDVEALGWSFAENVHREDVPGWLKIRQISRIYKELDGTAESAKLVAGIQYATSLSQPAVYEYLSIIRNLPEEVWELARRPEERSEKVTELIKRFSIDRKIEPIDIQKLSMIATNLGKAGYTLEKMMEVGVAVITENVPRDRMKEFLEAVRTFPNLPADEVYRDKVLTIPEGWRATIMFEAMVTRAIYEACKMRQMKRTELVRHYVTEGLTTDGCLRMTDRR